jgi:glycine dehydrogenase subunit 1
MLSAAGARTGADLFQDIDPALHPTALDLPSGLAEQALVRHVRGLAGANRLPDLCFLGGGAYPHFIPSTVDAVLSRGEFLTAYTPYQPEVAQGGLQAAWEYQSMVTALTGLPVTNASLYDGATAAAEAMLMAARETPGGRILVSRAVDPQYRAVLHAYARARDLPLEEIDCENGVTSPARLEEALQSKTAGILAQSPNYFGLMEDTTRMAADAHKGGALFISLWTEALSLALLAPPGQSGADIAAGEGMSWGVGLNYGGPGLGVLAARQELLRKLPGRLVGRTRDRDGAPGFVLTLQAREQHIRRETAASNICSNHALCALAAAVYLATLGEEGLRQTALVNYHRSHYARQKILELAGDTVKGFFSGHFFNEFMIKKPGLEKRLAELYNQGIAAGIPLERDYPELKDCLLVAVTETHTREEIDRLAEALA